MLTVKATTKKGQNLINRANHFEGTRLEEIYGKCSTAKQQAYNNCLKLCYEENGHNFHICSFNTFGFSVTWTTDKGIRMETPQNSYLIA